MDICSDDVSSTLRARGGAKTPAVLCLNDQGGQMMNVSYDKTDTLRAQEHQHQPLVLDSHPQDGRISFAGDTSQTLPGNMGTGGNTPMVMQETYALSHNDFMTKPSEEVADSLLASAYKDPTVISQGWQVRRLTPAECARLQGFPDRWAEDLALADEDITEDEMSFWRQAFGWAGKRKTDAAIRKWLKNPHSDAAEYKLWGNGVALPCATYVMCGIANDFHKEE